ncbi:MAG TPA: hypothetical protein VIK18_25910 [Pirellulales bacterium]
MVQHAKPPCFKGTWPNDLEHSLRRRKPAPLANAAGNRQTENLSLAAATQLAVARAQRSRTHSAGDNLPYRNLSHADNVSHENLSHCENLSWRTPKTNLQSRSWSAKKGRAG